MKKSPSKTDTFATLIQSISKVHQELAARAGKAINISLTLRNWLIGHYIAEYEQQGKDRAGYGAALLAKLSDELTRLNIPRSSERELRRYRLFYTTYPQIRESLPPELNNQLLSHVNPGVTDSRIVEEPTPQSCIDGSTIVSKLSFTHIAELIALDDHTKRAFYEIECMRGNWSVRELKRQIGSLYYERSGLSRDKKRLSEMAQKGAEARQKRILIGGEHFFVDLVFYHRILKCHVLVELKLEKFSHENLGQLNTYVSWYKMNMMTEGDNPPVGILLCTDKNHALAEYALAGMDIYRSLLDSILRRAQSRIYHHGVNYLRKLDLLAHCVRDWGSVETHDVYLLELRREHGRKSSFWSKYGK